MTTDPDHIRGEVAQLLAPLPDLSSPDIDVAAVDIDAIAARLEEAHEVLVRALESVEKG
jgi:hypothetical protein